MAAALLPRAVARARATRGDGKGNSLRSKRHAGQLPGERETREKRRKRRRKRKRRRRRRRRKRKRTKLGRGAAAGNSSSSSSGAAAAAVFVLLLRPWEYRRTRLVELPKGDGDDDLDFLAEEPSEASASGRRSRLPRRDAGRRLALPLEEEEALVWVPYNPGIKVSIQVVDDDDDEGADGEEAASGGSKRLRNQPRAVTFPGGAGAEGDQDRTLGAEDSTKESPSPHPPPNAITSTAKSGQNQASKETPRQPDGKKLRTGDKRGRGKHRRKLERENGGGEKEEMSQTGDYKEWKRRENAGNVRREGKIGDDRSERRREKEDKGKEKKGGQIKNEERRPPGWPQDLVQGLAEDLERILSTDKPGTQDPATATGEDPCMSWSTCRVETALQELADLPSLPTCPCLYPADLPYRHDLYDSLHRRSFRWIGISGERERIDIYHRGAHSCIRSHVTTTSLAAQTCCYDRERKLLTRGSGAGSPALVSPQVNFALHWQVDILPWLACRGNFLRYQAVRPPNNDQKCPTNPDNHKYQQQVYMATDY